MVGEFIDFSIDRPYGIFCNSDVNNFMYSAASLMGQNQEIKRVERQTLKK